MVFVTLQERGKTIATHCQLKFDGKLWLVPSESTADAEYQVDLQTQTCTCPYFSTGKGKCKHQFAVEEKIWSDHRTLKSSHRRQPVRQTKLPKRNWSGYNAAQMNEERKGKELLAELCRSLKRPPRKSNKGCKPLLLSEITLSLLLKVYEMRCARRTKGYLELARQSGLLAHAPHFNSIGNYLKKDWMTDILSNLVTASSLPLAAIETKFSVDSSGFGTTDKSRWIDVKYGNDENWRGWLKAHIICGNATNTVVSVIVSAAYAHDSPFFIPLVGNAAKNFRVEEVMADLAYSSRENLEFVDIRSARALIPFKQNAVWGSESEVWNKLLHYYSFHQNEFYAHYNQRSNAESTFSAIKAKFGERLRSRDETAKVNELLAKIVCYNVTVLIRSIYELKIEPVFWKANETESSFLHSITDQNIL